MENILSVFIFGIILAIVFWEYLPGFARRGTGGLITISIIGMVLWVVFESVRWDVLLEIYVYPLLRKGAIVVLAAVAIIWLIKKNDNR